MFPTIRSFQPEHFHTVKHFFPVRHKIQPIVSTQCENARAENNIRSSRILLFVSPLGSNPSPSNSVVAQKLTALKNSASLMLIIFLSTSISSNDFAGLAIHGHHPAEINDIFLIVLQGVRQNIEHIRRVQIFFQIF